MPEPPAERTLRCANAALNAAMALSVVGVGAYAVISHRLQEAWQLYMAAVAAVMALLWGAYYVCLCYRISPDGISRRSWWRTETRRWAQLTGARVEETSDRGIASCTICLTFAEEEWRISSDLLSLDDVQELKADLHAAGLLPPESNDTSSD